MSFPPSVKEKALVASQRSCCICHKFCGLKIELHHIELKGEGGTDTFENCIPLCFDCHSDQRSYDFKHPKGTKYTTSELLAHRDNWYKKVKSTNYYSLFPDYNQLDCQISKEIKEILPWDGSIDFLKSHPFGSPFNESYLGGLFSFARRCDDPTFEFYDADLEKFRKYLLVEIKSFLDLSAEIHVAHDRNPNILQIPREWSAINYKLKIEAAKRLESQANKVCESYDVLSREIRRRLGV